MVTACVVRAFLRTSAVDNQCTPIPRRNMWRIVWQVLSYFPQRKILVAGVVERSIANHFKFSPL